MFSGRLGKSQADRFISPQAFLFSFIFVSLTSSSSKQSELSLPNVRYVQVRSYRKPSSKPSAFAKKNAAVDAFAGFCCCYFGCGFWGTSDSCSAVSRWFIVVCHYLTRLCEGVVW